MSSWLIDICRFIYINVYIPQELVCLRTAALFLISLILLSHVRTSGVKYKLINIERGCVTGTDATHAEHIETIKSRMYVGLTSDQRFLPGELGMGLVEGTHRCIPALDELEHPTFGDAGFQPHLFRLQLHGL